jgi:hypothetical protein
MDDTDDLTDKQRRIVQRVAAGENWRTAAKAEGCTDSYARVIGHRLRKKPVVLEMLKSIRAEGSKMAAYDLARAMQEAQDVIDFAKLHKHPTAFFFAVRHRAHLSGLLVDEIHLKTENLDLKGALLEARTRTFGPIDITPGQRNTPLSARQALPDARGTEPDTDSSGSAGSGQDRAFGD